MCIGYSNESDGVIYVISLITRLSLVTVQCITWLRYNVTLRLGYRNNDIYYVCHIQHTVVVYCDG